MKRIIILCTLLMMIGCGGKWLSMRHESIAPSPADSNYFNEKNYNRGVEKTAYVGQEIIRVKGYKQKRSKFIDQATSQENIVIYARYKFNNYQIKIEKNKIYAVNDSIFLFNEKPNYLIKLTDNNGGHWGLVIDGNGDIYKKGIYSYDNLLMYFPDTMNINPENVKFSVHVIAKDAGIDPLMSYEIIYSGRNDVSLNATYKEFTPNDIARPAFFQNLTYKADAKQIRFKDFLIQIHEATNEKIVYTVLKDGLK
ncbi:MAG: hypothetical protein ABFD66_11805 [Smithella sp.]